MRAQLAHLIDLCERPDFALLVYPFTAGPDLGTQCTCPIEMRGTGGVTLRVASLWALIRWIRAGQGYRYRD